MFTILPGLGVSNSEFQVSQALADPSELRAPAVEPPLRHSGQVDTQRVLRDGANQWLGINLNYIRDTGANRPAQARPLDKALKEQGVRWLRYPGGGDLLPVFSISD